MRHVVLEDFSGLPRSAARTAEICVTISDAVAVLLHHLREAACTCPRSDSGVLTDVLMSFRMLAGIPTRYGFLAKVSGDERKCKTLPANTKASQCGCSTSKPEPTAAKSSRCGAAGAANDHGHHHASNGPSTKVIDPVCGMTVDPAMLSTEAKPIISARPAAGPSSAAAPEQYPTRASQRPRRRKAPSISARCIRRSARSAPAVARSAAWRWSRRSPA